MIQSLASEIAKTSAKVNTETLNKAEKAPTFFERNKNKVLSGEAFRSYASARAMAKGLTQDFMKSVHDSSHKDHAANLAAYRNEFGMDMKKVEKKYLDKISDDINSPDPEDLKEDPAYEARVLAEHRPEGEQATSDTTAFFSILTNNLKASRDARGYGREKCYDKQVIQDWLNKYGQQ